MQSHENVSLKRIGLALSGGGIRATIFHLGVLKWLAERQLLEEVAHISTVSGGSLCIGLVYAKSRHRFPGSSAFLKETLPLIKETILHNDIEATALVKLLLSPWRWDERVNLVAKVIEELWGISGSLADIPTEPLWSINCTTFETGKDFRFSQKSMGDYKLGYVSHPFVPLSDAVAASAGFPVLIGPYKLRMKDHSWNAPLPESHPGYPGPSTIALSPQFDAVHLWDGGVYDNLCLEALYKVDGCGHLTPGIGSLIVSNASASGGFEKRSSWFSARNLKRLLDINMQQVAALRIRDVKDYFCRNTNGYYVKIGATAERIAESAVASGYPLSKKIKDSLIAGCITPARAAYVKHYPTVLSTPSERDYDLILRHGYEAAKCTAVCFGRS